MEHFPVLLCSCNLSLSLSSLLLTDRKHFSYQCLLMFFIFFEFSFQPIFLYFPLAYACGCVCIFICCNHASAPACWPHIDRVQFAPIFLRQQFSLARLVFFASNFHQSLFVYCCTLPWLGLPYFGLGRLGSFAVGLFICLFVLL